LLTASNRLGLVLRLVLQPCVCGLMVAGTLLVAIARRGG
jgi:hypothetical protein